MSVSYQSILDAMQERYTQLSGVSPNDASDIGIRLKVLAQQICELYQNIQNTAKQAFPQTAEANWLELHAQQRGLTRKPESFATGQVVFRRDSATNRDIYISKGVMVSTKTQQSLCYQTTENATLTAGATQISVPVQCVSPGISGNVSANLVTVMVTPVPGIGSVNNPMPISGASAEESDDQLRERLFDTYKQVTNGTNASFYYNMAYGYPGVSSVNVIPRANGVGTVKVVIHGDGVNSDLVKKMAADMNAIKELNVVVTVQQAATTPVNISVEILIKAGFSFNDISAQCRSKLQSFMKNQQVGVTLYKSQIIRQILECEGVADCAITGPSFDVSPGNNNVVILNNLSILQTFIFEM